MAAAGLPSESAKLDRTFLPSVPGSLWNWLSVVGNLASVIGLLVSCYTLYKVASLPATLRRRSLIIQLAELMKKVSDIPEEKHTVVKSLATEIEHMVKIVRSSETSPWPFKHRRLREHLSVLEAEVQEKRRKEVVRTRLKQIYDEIEIG